MFIMFKRKQNYIGDNNVENKNTWANQIGTNDGLNNESSQWTLYLFIVQSWSFTFDEIED